MVRTATYRFDVTDKDAETLAKRVVALATARARINRSLYEVRAEVDDEGLLVHITVDGHSYWMANSVIHGEAMAVARTLRSKGTLVREQTEPTMRNLTVEQGRADVYEDRSRKIRQNRRERLERFKERMGSGQIYTSS